MAVKLLYIGVVILEFMKTLAFGKDWECITNKTLDAPVSPTNTTFYLPYPPFGFPLKSCGWFITAPENHIVKVQFSKSLLLLRYSSVFIYDVDGSDLNPVDGPSYSTAFSSKSRYVFIVFKYDKLDVIKEKIAVVYTAFKPGRLCSTQNSYDQNKNILLRNPSGVIKTPGFPLGYSDNSVRDCYWKLIAPKGKVVRLTFETFHLHPGDGVEIDNCRYDWYRWKLNKMNTEPSFTVFSTGRELGVGFDIYGKHHHGSASGFAANYSMVPGVSLGACIPKDNSTMYIHGEGMSFSTRGYPRNPGVGTCSWNISAPLGDFIKLTFWRFFGLCNQSYAEVFDISSSTPVFLGKYCDYYLNKTIIYSKGNNVIVKFSQLSTSPKQGGLIATYEALKTIPARYSCSRESTRINLRGLHGELASLDYPLLYPNNVACSWGIEVPTGYLIQLTFHSFDLEYSPKCQADYVEIKQGMDISWSTVIGRYCGTSLPSVLLSNYPKVYIDFVANSLARYRGFHASFTAVPDPSVGPCNSKGTITMSGKTGRLFSPRYPKPTPPRSINCTWMITVPKGNFVKLRLTSIKLEVDCSPHSTLEIRDGQNSSSRLLKSICKQPFYGSSAFSSGRHLWVRFRSPKQDWTYYFMFSAEFEAVTQLPASYSCTANNRHMELNSESGTLASYNYPLPYDDHGSCSWIIRVSGNKQIELSFDAFNLSEASPDCLDFLQISNDLDEVDLSPKLCGSKIPSSFTSKGSALSLWFSSSGQTKYPGFKASYKTKWAPLAILKIVAICVGTTTGCVLIGFGGYKCIKSRRNGSRRDADCVPLQEQAIVA